MTTAIHPFSPEEMMAYQDGELSPQRAVQASQHLAECRECQSLVEGLQGLSMTLSGWEVEPLSAAPPAKPQAAVFRPTIPFWRGKWFVAVPIGLILIAVVIVNRPRS